MDYHKLRKAIETNKLGITGAVFAFSPGLIRILRVCQAVQFC